MEEKSLLLSIITPVYNTSKYLSKCIESVIKQDYQNWELILVNDGSTDDSLSICEQYAQRDPRIRVFSQKNQGQSSARNLALDKVKGDLIAFLDSDDEIDACTYRLAIDKLIEFPICDHVQFPAHLGVVAIDKEYFHYAGEPIYDKEKLFSEWLIEEHITWTIWNKVYKKEVFLDLRFYEGIVFEDNLLVTQILARSTGICFSDEDGTGYLYYVRDDEHPEKREWTKKMTIDQIISNGEAVKELLKYRPNLSLGRCYFYQRLINNIFGTVKSFSYNNESLRTALPYLKMIDLRDLFRDNQLALKAKFKIILVKLLTYVL